MQSDILIADDEEQIRELLAEVLTDVGYRVRVATDGESALAAVQEHTPALILLDNMMPGISGREVMRLLRAQGFKRLPIIMMSAGTSRESLMRAGATDFLPKPFFLEDVLDCIASNLARTLPNDGRDTVKQRANTRSTERI